MLGILLLLLKLNLNLHLSPFTSGSHGGIRLDSVGCKVHSHEVCKEQCQTFSPGLCASALLSSGLGTGLLHVISKSHLTPGAFLFVFCFLTVDLGIWGHYVTADLCSAPSTANWPAEYGCRLINMCINKKNTMVHNFSQCIKNEHFIKKAHRV